VEISLEQLKDWDRFRQLCTVCGLTLPDTKRAAYNELVANKVNAKSKHPERSPGIPFEAQEEKVWQAMGTEGAALHAEVEARYGGSRHNG
jgi:hypothetical protein